MKNSLIDKIISILEKGVNPWREPWLSAALPINIKTGNIYKKGNFVTLLISKFLNKYTHNFWGTFNQYKNIGFHIKRGEFGLPLYFYNIKEIQSDISNFDKDSLTDQEIKQGFKINKLIEINKFFVFNIVQTNMSLKDINPEFLNQNFNENKKVFGAENIIKNFLNGPKISHENIEPYYSIKFDKVVLPDIEFFKSSEEYYSTLFHEFIHSTGSEKRLKRFKAINYFNSKSDKAKEELIAELGGAILCSIAGIENKVIQNSASYISGWLKVAKEDPTFLFKAGSKAQKAVDYILNKRGI